MKRLLILLAVLLVPTMALGQVTLYSNLTQNGSWQDTLARYDYAYYRGSIKNNSTGWLVSSMDVLFVKVANSGDISSQQYTARIWSVSGNNLVAQLGASTNTVTGSNAWTTTPVSYTYTFSPAVYVPPGVYAVTLDRAGYDVANYASIPLGNPVAGETFCGWYSSGVMNASSSIYSMLMTIYGTIPSSTLSGAATLSGNSSLR